MLLILMQDVVKAVDAGIPDSFAYTAIGWAVSITTGVAGLVLSGKLVLGRELTFAVSLYTKEKADREKIESAFRETNDELRLQNRTLATAVEVLQKQNSSMREDERSRDRERER